MKKIILLLICVVLLMTGCNSKGDSYEKFAEKYESMNGVKSSRGDIFRTISISKDNVFEETTISEVADMIRNKETFYLYVGDEMCPWCRATLESADQVSRELGIKKIYYLQLWDDDHKELFRNQKEFMADGSIETTIPVSDDYKVLLDLAGDLLKKYEIFNSKGEKTVLDEYRTYGANYFYVVDGKLKRFTESITPKLTDKFMELTDEIKQEQKEEYETFFGKSNACGPGNTSPC